MIKSFVGALMLVLIFALPAGAEFYRYTDEHGNTIYTDDYSKVPQDQREAVQSYEESASVPVVAAPKAKDGKSGAKSVSNEKINKTRLRLEQQQEALAKEFETLTAEREALDRDKKKAVTNSQIKAYNKKTIEFNARIKAYEEKRDAHTIEVEKFNAQMAEKESEARPQ